MLDKTTLGYQLANSFRSVSKDITLPIQTADEMKLVADTIERHPFKMLDLFKSSHMAGQACMMANYILGLSSAVPSQLKTPFDLSFTIIPPAQDDDTKNPTVSLRLGCTFMLGEICKGIAEIIRKADQNILG